MVPSDIVTNVLFAKKRICCHESPYKVQTTTLYNSCTFHLVVVTRNAKRKVKSANQKRRYCLFILYCAVYDILAHFNRIGKDSIIDSQFSQYLLSHRISSLLLVFSLTHCEVLFYILPEVPSRLQNIVFF